MYGKFWYDRREQDQMFLDTLNGRYIWFSCNDVTATHRVATPLPATATPIWLTGCTATHSLRIDFSFFLFWNKCIISISFGLKLYVRKTQNCASSLVSCALFSGLQRFWDGSERYRECWRWCKCTFWFVELWGVVAQWSLNNFFKYI